MEINYTTMCGLNKTSHSNIYLGQEAVCTARMQVRTKDG